MADHMSTRAGRACRARGAGFNKKVALLISVLALFLAFSETLGKSAQTAALNDQIEASNLWNFFQAKTIRLTVLRTAAERPAEHRRHHRKSCDQGRDGKQIDAWKKTAARYDAEPETNEGRKQLAERAKEPSTSATATGKLPPLRGGVGRIPDRHRAGVGRRSSPAWSCWVGLRRARPDRPRLHGHRALRAACASFRRN